LGWVGGLVGPVVFPSGGVGFASAEGSLGLGVEDVSGAVRVFVLDGFVH
jgi:hypothetical protein